MLLPGFTHARPRTLEEALALLDDESMPYHGGTELLAVMRMGLVRPGRLVDLKSVDELHGVTRTGDDIVIGAGSTHRDLATDPTIQAAAPLLAEVAPQIGNVRVRASGTVGGNLCFAEPRSDLATALLALQAEVVLRSRDGERRLLLEDFLLGAYLTDLQPGELLTAVRLRTNAAARAAYARLQTAERPTVGVAVAAPGAALRRYRAVVGAVGEMPAVVEADNPEEFDVGAVAAAVDVIPDLTGSAEYKRHVTAVYLRRALDALTVLEGTA